MWARLLILCCCGLLFGGCMISEQIGELPQELTFHFDTDFNRALVFGRSAGIVLFVMWLFAKFKKPTAALVGIPLLVLAAWAIEQDYPSLMDYRVEVREAGLYLSIPPELEEEILWSSIEEMKIEGVGWATAGHGGTVATPFGLRKTQYAWSELPEWKTMEIKAAGETHLVVLEKLSVEQRQTLWRAIAKRAKLVKQN